MKRNNMIRRIQKFSLVMKNYTHGLSHFSSVQLFATLWTVTCHALLFMGFSRQEYWSGLTCPSPGDLPDPGTEPVSPVSPALQVNSLPLNHWGSPHIYI